MVEYYRCTTSAGIPGTYRILDTISAGLYKDTFIVPKVEKIAISRLAYRYGVLSRFDRAALQDVSRRH